MQAGLFSAVLTAFLVETYSQMQPDNSSLTTEILIDISHQLENLSQNQVAPASSISLEAFRASTTIVAINSLWFLSLVFALASALLGILVKQWLREYSLWTTVAPIEHALHLRQYRYNSMKQWMIPTLVTALPTLLQISVVLFFGGLLSLLWPINNVVAILTTIGITFTILAAILAVVLPLLDETCPFKTPLGWTILTSMRKLRRIRHHWYSRPGLGQQFAEVFRRGVTRYSNIHIYENWVHRDISLPSLGQDPVRSIIWKCQALLWTAAHEELDQEVISHCVASLPGARLRTRAELAAEDNVSLLMWPDKPHKRLCAYWLVISEFLGHNSYKTLPLFDKLRSLYTHTQNQHRPDDFRITESHIRVVVAPLNPTQLRTIFSLLASGIKYASEDKESPAYIQANVFRLSAPFGYDNMQYLYLNSLYMMCLVCDLLPEL
jgi:hypothetical protein